MRWAVAGELEERRRVDAGQRPTGKGRRARRDWRRRHEHGGPKDGARQGRGKVEGRVWAAGGERTRDKVEGERQVVIGIKHDGKAKPGFMGTTDPSVPK